MDFDIRLLVAGRGSGGPSTLGELLDRLNEGAFEGRPDATAEALATIGAQRAVVLDALRASPCLDASSGSIVLDGLRSSPDARVRVVVQHPSPPAEGVRRVVEAVGLRPIFDIGGLVVYDGEVGLVELLQLARISEDTRIASAERQVVALEGHEN